jgi:CRISPR/Cas system-associated exonuclease Cas4 (RecB family)
MLTPSKLTKILGCERQSILSVKSPISGGNSLPLVNGSAVHEAYRQVDEMSKISWKDDSMAIQDHIINDTNYVCEDVLQQVKTNYPEFYLDIQRNIPFYKAWLYSWLFQRMDDFETLINNGASVDTAVAIALPLAEVDLKSYEYGLYGRADQVYIANGTVKVVDLKTDERITSFLNEEGHVIQLVAYSVMAAETFNLPCQEVSLLYVKNQEESVIPITSELIQKLDDTIKRYKEIMSTPELPPLLTGLAADLRCPRCPWKKSCYRQAELNGEI